MELYNMSWILNFTCIYLHDATNLPKKTLSWKIVMKWIFKIATDINFPVKRRQDLLRFLNYFLNETLGRQAQARQNTTDKTNHPPIVVITVMAK